MSDKIRGNKKIAVNSVQIEVKSFKNSMEDLRNSLKKIDKGEDIKETKIVFNDLDTLRRLLWVPK